MLKRKTVVIVDDNLANVFALKAVLKPFGCNILTLTYAILLGGKGHEL